MSGDEFDFQSSDKTSQTERIQDPGSLFHCSLDGKPSISDPGIGDVLTWRSSVQNSGISRMIDGDDMMKKMKLKMVVMNGDDGYLGSGTSGTSGTA